MESVKILRELWRKRVFVALVGLLAIGIGWMISFGPTMPPKSRSYVVGMATARILVDTPQSQVVEVAPKGSETLGARASVLANLMVYGEIKDVIAKRAGRPTNKVIAGSDSSGGAAVAPLMRDSYALTTGVVVNTDLAQLPLIKVETQAPTPQAAAKLANAAVDGLVSYVNSKASMQGVSADRRLRVTSLGPAQAHAGARGPGKTMGLAATIFVFLAGCTTIVILSGLIRAWRAAAAAERQFVPDDAEFAKLLEPDSLQHTSTETNSSARR